MFWKFSDFLKVFVTSYLSHWLHFWQLRTMIWTITLWPLNTEWWWQHSQFLRCFVKKTIDKKYWVWWFQIWKSSLLCFPFLMDECESVPGGQSRPFPTRFCDKNFHKIDLGAKSNFREKSGRHYHNQDYGPNGRQNIYAWSLVFFAPLPKGSTFKVSVTSIWALPK